MDARRVGTPLCMAFLIDNRIYPYCRTTQRQMFADPRYKKYHGSKMDIAWQVEQIMRAYNREMLPKSTPLRMALIVNTKSAMHRSDASNVHKTVEDAVQRIAYQNDAWIDQFVFHRALRPKAADLALFVIDVIDHHAALPVWAAEVWELAEACGLKL